MEIFQKIFRVLANKWQDEPPEAILDWAEDIDQLHIAKSYFDAIEASVTEQIVSKLSVFKFINLRQVFKHFSPSFRSSSSSFDDFWERNHLSVIGDETLSMFDSSRDSMFEDTFRRVEINPATGLPMLGSVFDVNGNPYGFDDSHWSSSHDHWGSSSFNDRWSSSSFGSRWDD